MPMTAMPSIRRLVAIGRRMKISETFTLRSIAPSYAPRRLETVLSRECHARDEVPRYRSRGVARQCSIAETSAVYRGVPTAASSCGYEWGEWDPQSAWRRTVRETRAAVLLSRRADAHAAFSALTCTH